MSRLWLGILLAVSLGACTPNKKAPAPSEPAICSPTTCPIKDVIQEEDWQFTLTGSGWTPVKPPGNVVKVIFANTQFNTVTFFAKEETSQTPAMYTINALRTFRSAGTMVDATYQTTINGNVFVLVAAHGMTRNFWTWINVHKGAGYVFSCAIDDNDHTLGSATSFDRCREIAETIKFQ